MFNQPYIKLCLKQFPGISDFLQKIFVISKEKKNLLGNFKQQSKRDGVI